MEDLGRSARRRWQGTEAAEERRLVHWAPRWRRLLPAKGTAPKDYREFDRTVRGMLNRISIENANRMLPLEPSLRGAELAADDSPPWWAARFAALMLSSYLQVIHTNRYARGLVMRSSDNVLPGYLDAMSPLLVKSPRLVTAVMAWLARLLHWHDLRWMTTRLLILASRETRDYNSLPEHALGRLPPEIIRVRILSFLVPVRAPDNSAAGVLLQNVPKNSSWSTEEVEMDAVSVLAHLIMFSPLAIWRRLSAFSFSLVEAALIVAPERQQVYLAASVLASLAQRIEGRLGCAGSEELRQYCTEDLGPLSRSTTLLREAADTRRKSLAGLCTFIDSRVQVAIEHAHVVQKGLQPHQREPHDEDKQKDSV